MKKSWGILVHLGMNMWGDAKAQKELHFDMDVWNKIVDRCVEKGIDTILLDVGEGICFHSHPEIGIEGSWTPEKATAEVRRLKKLGISLVPKLNFSTVHDAWLGIYERMVSTPVYYQVCRDLIHEIYEIFDHPEYIHLGMDEETAKHADDPDYTYVALRFGDLWIHDAKYLYECVKETGAKCHMWQCTFVEYGDAVYNALPNDIVIGSSHYYSHKKENWHRISEQSEREKEYYATRFVKRHGYSIEYIEEDPVVAKKMEGRRVMMQKGYHIMIVTTNLFTKTNEIDEAEHIKEAYTKEQEALVDGFMACPWLKTVKENEAGILEQIDLLAKAKEYYLS